LSRTAEPQEHGRLKRGFAGLELWCADLAAAGRALHEIERVTPRLSAAERRNAEGLNDAAVAAEWLTAHIALRILLERAVGTGWRGAAFGRGAHGKPQLDGAPVVFSLSHVPGLALIGISPSGTLGVDVERKRPVRVGAERREAIEAAGAALNSEQALPQGADERFLQAWVRLEALAKAEGCGIGRLLTRLGVVGDRKPSSAAVHERAKDALAAVPGAVTRDLVLGEGLYTAVALSPAQAMPQVLRLPASVDALKALLT